MTAAQKDFVHAVLVKYDEARKAEGYGVARRHFCKYHPIDAIGRGHSYGEHVETVYLTRDGSLPALLVKIEPNGATSAWQAV